MKTTLRDIARECQVDISTVSRALREDERVKPATRELIQQTAASLGYRPNLAARSLVAGKTFTIWMILQNMNSATERRPAEFASLYLAEHGYDLLITLQHGDPETYSRILGRMEQNVADGALIIPGSSNIEDDDHAKLREKGVPVVFLDRSPESSNSPVVTTNNHDAAAGLVQRCIQDGVRTIFLNFPPDNAVQQARLGGALSIPVPKEIKIIPIETHDLHSLESHLASHNNNTDISDSIKQITQGPSAIISTNQGSIIRLSEALQGKGITPEIGGCFDGWTGSTFPLKKAHVCIQNFEEMARIACDILLEAIDDKSPSPQKRLVNPLRFEEIKLDS